MGAAQQGEAKGEWMLRPGDLGSIQQATQLWGCLHLDDRVVTAIPSPAAQASSEKLRCECQSQ